jgi:large subunit ribosomal protein L22
MPKHKYAYQGEDEEHCAKAVGISLPISKKHAIELARFIRYKELNTAKAMLKKVMLKKLPVPFRRFTEVPHKKGRLASGRYPIKAAEEFLEMLESVEANAQFKGLNTSNLFIVHLCVHDAPKQRHYGRRGRLMKRAHLEIIVKERQAKKEEKQRERKEKSVQGVK